MININNKEVSSITIGGKEVATITIGGKTAYENTPAVEPDYFYIENLGSGDNTLTLKSAKSSNAPSAESRIDTLEYSTDKRTWNSLTWDGTSQTQTITIPSGGKVYMRNDKGVFNLYVSLPAIGVIYYYISMYCSDDFAAGGDVTTLLDYTGTDTSLKFKYGCFYRLFYTTETANKYKLKDVSDLKLNNTTLASYCYNGMFQNTGITTAPSLPATTLASHCYDNMFSGCKLTTPPSLPVTTLADYCYANMFTGCTALTSVPALPATTLARSCYQSMFQGCTSLTSAPTLPATTLARSCYQSMFQGCTSLTSAPTLPATTLVQECYKSMFYGASYLNSVTTYADDISASNCLNNWLSGVANSGILHNYGSAIYTTDSASGIPTGWTEVKHITVSFSNTYISNIGNNQAELTSDITVSSENWTSAHFEVYNVFDRDRSIDFYPTDIYGGVLVAANKIPESGVDALPSPANVTFYKNGYEVWSGEVPFTTQSSVQRVATPTYSVTENTNECGQPDGSADIELSCSTTGATIISRRANDTEMSDPDFNWNDVYWEEGYSWEDYYYGGVQNIQAKAIKAGMTESEILEFSYTVPEDEPCEPDPDEPVDCSDWENIGYGSYEECDCAENGNCPEEEEPDPEEPEE